MVIHAARHRHGACLMGDVMFSGKIAVITGASSGIGRAIALQLAARGATLHLISRRPEVAATVADHVPSSSARTHSHQADLAMTDTIQAVVDQLHRQRVEVDLLVHAAGVIAVSPMTDARLADLDYQYSVNVRAPYQLTQALLAGLIRRQGQVVFINSSISPISSAGLGQYMAMKYALRGIADSLRAEVNAAGVRVLSVFPGRTATPMQEALHRRRSQRYAPDDLLQPADIATAILSALALPRTAEVTDLHIRPFVNRRDG